MMNMIKAKMILKGRKDFTQYLSDILGVGITASCKRWNGETKISLHDLKLLTEELELSKDEIYEIVMAENVKC